MLCFLREQLVAGDLFRPAAGVLEDIFLSTWNFFHLGKTLLAKAVANQTSATFLRVVGSELIQKYLVRQF